MSYFSKIKGTIETMFQFGLGRSQIKSYGTPSYQLELRDSTDSVFIRLGGADATTDDEFTTQRQSIGTVATVTTTNNISTVCGSLALADNTVYLVEVQVTGRRTDSPGRATYIRTANVYREGAGVATVESTVDDTFTRDSNFSYDATITVSGNNVRAEVLGVIGHTINWKTYIRLLKVS